MDNRNKINFALNVGAILLVLAIIIYDGFLSSDPMTPRMIFHLIIWIVVGVVAGINVYRITKKNRATNR